MEADGEEEEKEEENDEMGSKVEEVVGEFPVFLERADSCGSASFTSCTIVWLTVTILLCTLLPLVLLKAVWVVERSAPCMSV